MFTNRDTARKVLMIVAAMSLNIGMISPVQARGGHAARAVHQARANHHDFHQRRNELMSRNRNMNRRMDRDYGHLGGNFNKVQGERQNVAHQERKDYRQNGGYLTKGEQKQFNKDDNKINRQIANDYRGPGNWNKGQGNNRQQWDNRQRWDREHPRQSQVLGNDNRIGSELRRDKGDLGGNYQSLKNQQQQIRKEDIADRKADGGHITQAQRQQMDQQEKQLQQQIKTDYTKP